MFWWISKIYLPGEGRGGCATSTQTLQQKRKPIAASNKIVLTKRVREWERACVTVFLAHELGKVKTSFGDASYALFLPTPTAMDLNILWDLMSLPLTKIDYLNNDIARATPLLVVTTPLRLCKGSGLFNILFKLNSEVVLYSFGKY